MNFQKAYQRNRVALSFLDEDGNPLPTMTQQHMKQETDINYILKQYDKTGLITHVNNAVANYGDFTTVNEYQQSLNMVMQAQEAFNALPSEVRKRFFNDPGEFFEFATNPENKDEMVAMGLAHPPAPEPVSGDSDPATAPEGGQTS